MVNKYVWVAVICISLILGSFTIYYISTGGQREQVAFKYAVLIGWDGTQRNHLKELLAEGKLPNLAALSAEGAIVELEVTSGATDTKAGWTQILTGYGSEMTGVWSNEQFQTIPEGYTIFERLENSLGAENIVTIMLVGKDN